MKCQQARMLIQLNCGSDLTPAESSLLKTHLADCQACRIWELGMQAPMAALHALRDSASYPTESVWPAVSRAIRASITPHTAVRRFNLQVAAISVCSLLLAAATIAQTLSALRTPSTPSSTAWFPSPNPPFAVPHSPTLRAVASNAHPVQPDTQSQIDHSINKWSRGAQDF
jgi:predicted anti-sigma-YlaC factor YlaD